MPIPDLKLCFSVLIRKDPKFPATRLVLYEKVQDLRVRVAKEIFRNENHRRLMVRTVKYPLKVLDWGCFLKKGFRNLHLLTGTLDAEEMMKICKKSIIAVG